MPGITTADIDALDGNVRSAVLPIGCLSLLKEDIIRFSETEKLNVFQKWIARKGYVLDVPALPFEAKSLVLVTVKHQLAEMVFHFGDRQLRDINIVDRKDLREKIDALFLSRGYHAESVFWLPLKRLAVCAGLAEYGRNNITYTDAWGSFFEIIGYFSDLPCTDASAWREVRRMAACDDCSACRNSCPTKAIREDTYLIDNLKCVTHYIEGDKPFPGWLPGSSIHSVVGCRRCQEACPADRGRLEEIAVTVNFDAEESALLMAGLDPDAMPVRLAQKINMLGMSWRLPSLPKNFKALLDN